LGFNSQFINCKLSLSEYVQGRFPEKMLIQINRLSYNCIDFVYIAL
jgi:hypothetical protein